MNCRGHSNKRVLQHTGLTPKQICIAFSRREAVFRYSDGDGEHWILHDPIEGGFIEVILETESKKEARNRKSRKIITVIRAVPTNAKERDYLLGLTAKVA